MSIRIPLLNPWLFNGAPKYDKRRPQFVDDRFCIISRSRWSTAQNKTFVQDSKLVWGSNFAFPTFLLPFISVIFHACFLRGNGAFVEQLYEEYRSMKSDATAGAEKNDSGDVDLYFHNISFTHRLLMLGLYLKGYLLHKIRCLNRAARFVYFEERMRRFNSSTRRWEKVLRRTSKPTSLKSGLSKFKFE